MINVNRIAVHLLGHSTNMPEINAEINKTQQEFGVKLVPRMLLVTV